MTPPPRMPLDDLFDDIAAARGRQLACRVAWARSPNADTVAATKFADRELDMLLDRLLMRLSLTGIPTR